MVCRFGGPAQVVVTVVLGILLLKLLFSTKNKNLPPGPRALPIIGNLHLLGPYPHRDLAKLADTYGPVMRLRLGQKPFIVASNRAAAQEILQTHDLNFSNRMAISFGELVLTNGMSSTITLNWLLIW